MTKLFKILLWTGVSLVVVVLLAAVLIPVLVDPNDYKKEIAQQVYDKTGRTLTIGGDIDLAISLPLSVSLGLGSIELSNAPGFDDKPFARMQSASLYVAIWPLLTQNRLDVGEIKLIGMELNLIRNKQGVSNWDDLSGDKTDSQTTSAPDSKEKAPSKATKATPAISVAGLNIKDAQISWTDEQANQTILLSRTNLNISELIEDEPFELTLATHLDSKNPAIKGTVSLSSSPEVSLSRQLFNLPGSSLTLDLTGKMLPGGANKTTLGGDIKFDGQAQTLHIDNMKLTSYDMIMNGVFQAAQLNSAPEFTGQLSIEQFSPRQLASTLGAALPKMKQDKALSTADARLSFKGNNNSITISSLEANLDNTSLTGSALIKDFAKPHYGFDLILTQLNLDYYAVAKAEKADTKTATVGPAPASPKATGSKSTSSKASGSKDATALFPLETLRQLNLSGKLKIAEFIAGGAKMTDVLIVLKGNNGIVQLAPLQAKLYQGSINLKTDIDARSNTPKLKIINDLKNVQLGDLLQDTTGSQEFTGSANINANITTTGNNKDQLLKNSNGSGTLLVTDGHIKKLDILSTLRKAQALYRGYAAPTETQDKNTKFTELKGTFKVSNGVVKNNDLASKSPVMEVTGQGYADLPKEYLDYTLNIKLLNSLKIDEKSQGTDYRGKEIPYTIKGKFSELSEEANISKVLEQEVKKKLKKKLNKELEDKLGDKLKGLLKF